MIDGLWIKDYLELWKANLKEVLYRKKLLFINTNVLIPVQPNRVIQFILQLKKTDSLLRFTA